MWWVPCLTGEMRPAVRVAILDFRCGSLRGVLALIGASDTVD